MAVVGRGLGQPEDGALVTGGLGLAGVADPNAMSAHLSGSGTVTADLTAAVTILPPLFGGGPARPKARPKAHVANGTAALAGAGTVSASLTFVDHWQATDDFNINVELLLLELV